jgi:hypothetical protein
MRRGRWTGDYATRLVATSLYGRVHVAKGAQQGRPAEPVVFRGSIGIPQFSFRWPTIADFIRRNV